VTSMDVRQPDSSELDQLSRIWFDGWYEAHAHLVPAALTRVRTLESFRARLAAALPLTRVVGEPGRPLGFHMIRESELFQLFVSPEARGSGAAAALIADAESLLRARGVHTAWLACAIGNDRAARFYEKSGWRRTGTMINKAETSEGTFALEVWRYEKQLTGG
jgi:GNAT superfamily N-acetyltransferase